jgi:hypothetical protein
MGLLQTHYREMRYNLRLANRAPAANSYSKAIQSIKKEKDKQYLNLQIEIYMT